MNDVNFKVQFDKEKDHKNKWEKENSKTYKYHMIIL